MSTLSPAESPNVDVTQCSNCAGKGIVESCEEDRDVMTDALMLVVLDYIKSKPPVHMYETDLLYQQTLGDPDNTTLRLAYADALDELPSDVNPYIVEHDCDMCNDGRTIDINSSISPYGSNPHITVKVAPNQTIKAGDLLTCDANGFAVPITACDSNTRQLNIIGKAIECKKCKGSGKTYTGYDKLVKAKFIRVQCRLHDIILTYYTPGLKKVTIGEEHRLEYAGLKMQQKILASQLGHTVLREGLVLDASRSETSRAPGVPSTAAAIRDPSPTYNNAVVAYVERGFLSRVECTTQWWFGHGSTYVAKHPITDVVINDLTSFVSDSQRVHRMTVDTWDKKECMATIADVRSHDKRDQRMIAALSKTWPTVTRWKIV